MKIPLKPKSHPKRARARARSGKPLPRKRRFSAPIVEATRAAKILGMRVGDASHRFIGIWVVVANDRVFVRSWDLTAGGWNDRLRSDRLATVQIGERTLRVRAAPVKGETMQAAVDRAYLEKYATPGSLHYSRGMARGRRRASTLELLPR